MWCRGLDTPIDAKFGGMKAARLSEIFSQFPVPSGFVLASEAYTRHVSDLDFASILKELDVDDLDSLLKVSGSIKTLIVNKPIAPDVLASIKIFADTLLSSVAVRSSSVQEDTPTLSFAGQYDSFLDIDNRVEILEQYVKLVWASLYTPRVLSYRHHNKLSQESLSIAVLVQSMRHGLSGVIFSVSPDTGEDEVLIEFHKDGVVDGTHNATSIKIKSENEITDCKALSSVDQLLLFNYTKQLGNLFKCPLDIEWVKDKNYLSVLQVRPLKISKLKVGESRYTSDIPILIGSAVGSGMITGIVQKVKDPRDKFKEGSILVVRDTSPDWEPVMRKAKALITDHGSRTSHASLVAREMGLPAIVGTSDASFTLADGQTVTLDLSPDVGLVYGGSLK